MINNRHVKFSFNYDSFFSVLKLKAHINRIILIKFYKHQNKNIKRTFMSKFKLNCIFYKIITGTNLSFFVLRNT